ncbi:hypothetical protein AAFF_G00072410 [Aldrovandia affinis]|uniref:Uncharacterized protein n=1 Tax=Aldrovandia affinis TaxID=143900 RepID=A0AAD7WD83_9TELE|nr:hypothetical protein AAFF_G00072410 [Aldrovandia affinis]
MLIQEQRRTESTKNIICREVGVYSQEGPAEKTRPGDCGNIPCGKEKSQILQLADVLRENVVSQTQIHLLTALPKLRRDPSFHSHCSLQRISRRQLRQSPLSNL